MIRLVVVTIAALLIGGAAIAAPGDRLDRSQLGPLAFADEFNQVGRSFRDPVSIWSPLNPTGTWKTDYYFGNQRGAYWRPTTRIENLTARSLPGELQAYVDPEHCPGSAVLHQGGGHLFMRAYRATPVQVRDCTGGRAYLAPLITTEKSFAQAFGYWEVRASLPQTWGSWSAFWLLPRDRTAANQGRLPEVDVFEHYAGPHRTIRSAPGVPLDRTGRANITIHTAAGMRQPPVQPATNTALPHTYGVLWTRDELVFYLDDRETWRTPFSSADPAYLLLNIAVSDITAGDPALAPYTLQQPAQMVVDWVRVWAPPAL